MKKLFLIGVLVLGLITTAQAANEGIQVHGHWQFDIYNKDGSFDRKVEFENALDSAGGSLFLTKLLQGELSVGYWQILVADTSSNLLQGVCDFNGSPSVCDTTESGFNAPGSNGILTSSISNGNLIFNGSFVAFYDGQLQQVVTRNFTCSSTLIPRSCNFNTSSTVYSFTNKDLLTSGLAVDVQAGQTINITVTISFS